ncbi:type III-B CRISPR-associated protein Cas10/Cmr2 [Deinococcus piscis]|uniref:Type III-B CRISPR-associated protein Cas10/Cmr2 n=1 Tax=Deinococcus piscis TaxID=394230 RepID=A0ABQ3KBG4_9DEIO|nr:type III-B CRISPR-associated protein Cas10/Cmr2 [Deinococcus piscis]GHG09743.1 type III-B CRISPR-associated protein Cas10/Cmr2 [Deinococcus piscis]
MTYLLSISIGPVQEFIAAARKTADLYAGSTLLSRVVREAVGAIETRGGAEFVFPADTGSDGANKILVRVPSNPSEYAAVAKAAATAFLKAEFGRVTGRLTAYLVPERADAQLEHFLEFYAAWVEEKDDYAADRQKVEKLLAGRKALREFESFSQHDENDVPKSPLDPAFACVFRLEKGRKIPDELQKRLGLKDSEYLDAISLLKREWGRTEVGKVPDTHQLAHWAKFPEEQEPPQDPEREGDSRPAYAYYAILVADGDNMGAKLEALEQSGGMQAHQNFSRALDAFATKARHIVTEHDGFAVYTGGDDVLALLPLTRALACAEALRDAFGKQTEGCTLSAGLAIVHYREPLSTSLGQARAAEKVAKRVDGKDALCVALHTRGGSPLEVGGHWPLAAQLQFWQGKPLPRGLPYELRELAREWPAGFEPQVLSAEARRIAARKSDAEGQKLSAEDLVQMSFASAEALENFAKMLILARFLSGEGDRA